MTKPIYLDYMATTPVDPRVTKKMIPYLSSIDGSNFGNPASKHYYGYKAHEAIEEAAKQVATLINCDSKNIIWTSGATESNNLAIKGSALFYKRQGKHIITCKTEHKSVLDTCNYLETQDFDVTYLNPEPDGLIDLDKLESALRSDTVLVSIMHVNNEIGVIQDIEKIGKLAKSRGILFHVDAAQSLGKIKIDLNKLPVDLMSFSSHKIYGPKGIGALYIRSNPKIHLEPQFHGGEQKNNFRPGTLPTHQIVGLGEATRIAAFELNNEEKKIAPLKNSLLNAIKKLDGIQINGSTKNRIYNNINISFDNLSSELLISALKDLAISTASSCTKLTSEPSHVLKAIGVPRDLILNSIRISLGRFTTKADIDKAISDINKAVNTLR